MKVDTDKCVGCKKCTKACKMDVDVTASPNHPECIRCGACIKACPANAICYKYGFGGTQKDTTGKSGQKDLNIEQPSK